MRLRRDIRGEVGVFEDLQTLLVIVVGIAILLSSTLYNWSAFGSAEQDQEMYDEVEHLIDSVEAWDQLRAVNSYGSYYPEFQLRQSGLNGMSNKAFQDHILSDLNYNISFDDLAIPDGNHDPEDATFSYYYFGKPVPEDKETVVAGVQYALIFEKDVGTGNGDVKIRHACIMTVVVWQ
jgi:hypothetical protein